MIIYITAQGDADAASVRQVYERGGDTEEIFAASVQSVTRILERGGRININQALLLLAARASDSLTGGVGDERARQDVSELLSSEQVMIGVPEMTRNLEIRIETTNRTFRLDIRRDDDGHNAKKLAYPTSKVV